MSLSSQTLRAGHTGSASPRQADQIERYSHDYLVRSDAFTSTDAGGHTCDMTELYFQRTLHDRSLYEAGRTAETSPLHGGCAVFHDESPVGLVKHHKSELLLAVSTVRDSTDTYDVIRGGVYLTDLSFNRHDEKPRWSYSSDSVAVRPARRLDADRFVSRYEPSSIEEMLGMAEEAMHRLRRDEAEIDFA